MPGKVLNYACKKFKFLVGDLDITNCVTSFGVAQSKYEVGKPLIWSGSMTLATPMPPYNIAESLDNLENQNRWAKGRYPVKVSFFGCQMLTLRISGYSYNPDTKEAEAQLTDLLGLMDFDHDPKETEVQTENTFDSTGSFYQTKAPWDRVVAANLVRGSRINNQEYVRAGQISFPSDLSVSSGKTPSYSVPPPIASNPVQQISQISVASGGWVPWVDALENIRFCRYPLGEIPPVYSLDRDAVDEFTRGEPEEDEISSMSVIASSAAIVQPESRDFSNGGLASYDASGWQSIKSSGGL
ncbi:hypothetical protein [Floridanema evergladense]|uniref:Capsid protein n=1 Tax=Floridaenema evergladense BLCC-F167 TaxID=3153639 RepID=A0ABV4WDB1_9CYAN